MADIKILIVDDSPLSREIISYIFSSQEDIEIVGVANNGIEALKKLKTSQPDLITMDISMPKMDGMETIKKIMAENPIPILVISDITDSKVGFIALAHGALDVIPKSWLQPETAHNLIEKVRLLAKVKLGRNILTKRSATNKSNELALPTNPKGEFEHIISIASSTGGPKTLDAILSGLPAYFPYPILIVQHIDVTFVDSLVDFLSEASPLKIVKGEDGEIPVGGTVYISPGNMHMTLDKFGKINLSKPETDDIHIPSCDQLLSSVADAYGEKSVGVILTGMGGDGVKGIKKIKGAGGATIAQDEESCVIFGMPNLAIKTGCVENILSPKQISAHLNNLMKKKVET